MSGGINPESVNSQIEPEGKNLFEQSHNFGVGKVQVGLFGVELMKVVLPACLIKSPSRTTKHTSLEIEKLQFSHIKRLFCRFRYILRFYYILGVCGKRHLIFIASFKQ